MANTPPPGGQPFDPFSQNPTEASTYQWVVAWILVILLGAALMQTQVGYRVVYYGLVLILVFLLVTQYKFITGALAPIGHAAPAA